MAKVRDVLKHVKVEVAVRRRSCGRSDEHEIRARELCLVVREVRGQKNYCASCAAKVLEVAATKVAQLTRELGLGGSTTGSP